MFHNCVVARKSEILVELDKAPLEAYVPQTTTAVVKRSSASAM
ncbi:hypothetical protein [Streptomyces sp. NPDC093149]